MLELTLDLDGTGKSTVNTGCGFFDHMMILFAKHGRFDLELICDGDTYVDDHHVLIGSDLHKCSGPRIHVGHTGQVENFRLMHHFIYDRLKRRYLMVGCVGENSDKLLEPLDVRRQRPFGD